MRCSWICVSALGVFAILGLLAIIPGSGLSPKASRADASPATSSAALASPAAQGSLPPKASRPSPVIAGAPSQSTAGLPPVQGGVFHPHRVTPYFQSKPTALLREALIRGDLDAALVAATAAQDAGEPHRERLTFVTAWLLAEAKRHAEAAPLFETLQGTYGLLSGLSAYFGARSFYHLGLHDRALALAAKVPRDEATWPRTLLLVGDIHRARARWSDAVEAYEAFLKGHSGRHGTQEARLRLAESLTALPGTPSDATRRRIVELLRRVTLEAPGSPWARMAEVRMAGALAALPPGRARASLQKLRCADELLRTEAHLGKGRLVQAATSLAAAQKLGACPPRPLCQAATELGRRQSRRKPHRKAALANLTLAEATCRAAGQVDPWVKATYSLARTHAALGRPEEALRLFRAIEARHPKHSYADDARYQQAVVLRKTGREKQADALLRSLPRLYPRGDMSHAALWRLAWEAYQKGAFKDALALLIQAEALPGDPDREEDAGRATYWRGRVLGRLDRSEEAIGVWAALARSRPLSFYALLALNRLGERAPETASAILATWRPGEEPTAKTFGPVPLFERPGFGRAVELARLGLGDLASQEFAHIGLVSPVRLVGESASTGASVTSEPKDRSLSLPEKQGLWAAAVLYDRVGLMHRSHWIVRSSLTDHQRRPPTGTDRLKWRVGFPEAYAALVRENAKARKLPPPLVFGLMREESAFNPRLVSHARAVGLMQLLEETATRFRAGPKGPITRATLQDPARNVPIGTRYLAWLIDLFHGQLVLAVAAYNAGETRVFSWMQERGHLPVDHFVEEIPFTETRRYVKRVLGSAFAYAVLEPADAPLFTLPEVFPPDLVVKARTWQKRTQRWIQTERSRSAKPKPTPKPRPKTQPSPKPRP